MASIRQVADIVSGIPILEQVSPRVAQREAVLAFLNGGKWTLVAEFVEVESGKRNDRPQRHRHGARWRVVACQVNDILRRASAA